MGKRRKSVLCVYYTRFRPKYRTIIGPMYTCVYVCIVFYKRYCVQSVKFSFLGLAMKFAFVSKKINKMIITVLRLLTRGLYKCHSLQKSFSISRAVAYNAVTKTKRKLQTEFILNCTVRYTIKKQTNNNNTNKPEQMFADTFLFI